MLPEERELTRLQIEQANLEEQVTSAELALETTKAEIARFQFRYYQAVGRLYAQLDELAAQIANALKEQSPNDATAKAKAYAARVRAKKSAEEAGLIEVQPEPAKYISPELKEIYRRAVKLMHPDRATTEQERQRRTELMQRVNLAYARGDQSAIEKIIREYGEDPEAIIGEDVASRIVKAIRRIAQLNRRLGEIKQEIDIRQKSEIFQLKQTIEEKEIKGNDPLNDLVSQLRRQIADEEKKLNKLNEKP